MKKLAEFTHLTFLKALEKWSESQPDKAAFTALNGKAEINKCLTYGELWSLSGILAAQLLKEGVQRGQRVMIMYPVNAVADYMVTLIACMRICVTPVSIYPPNPAKLDQDLKKFQVFLENADANMVLTNAEYKRFVQMSSIHKKWPSGIKKWLATDTILKKNKNKSKKVQDHQQQDDDIIFIQYTSGSTGNPKGVPIHYRSLMTSILYGSTELERTPRVNPSITEINNLIWVPIYHDYGLISSLMTLYAGQSLFNLDPITFIQNPLIWPICMEKYKINGTMAPNFSYALVARKMKESGRRFDLSLLARADLAAEPIIHSTIQDMINVLGIKKEAITHSYGFAEACIWVTTCESEFDPDTFVAACGDVEVSKKGGMDFCIANKETLTLCKDGETGDVFVQGTGIVKEYWKNPDASQAFKYQLKEKQGMWYLAGDVGYIKQGKLYLTGRSKDLIIVNGKNIYPTDIERRFEEELTEFVRPGCSASFQTGDDSAAIVMEVKPGEETVLTIELIKSITSSLEKEFGLTFSDVFCCKKGSVPKTTSGKIRRSEAKKMHSEKQFKPVLGVAAGKDNLAFDTFDQMLTHFGVVDMERTLVENGVDSMKLTQLIEVARSQFGVVVDFEKAQTVACKDLQSTEGGFVETPLLPSCEPEDKTLPFHPLFQTLGVALVILTCSISAIPSAYLNRYLTSRDFLKSNSDWRDGPWLRTFNDGPGFLYIMLAMLWMATFSLINLIAKWVLIGKYKETSHSLWSWGYLRWWYVERLNQIWFNFIGCYFLDTPYINFVYMLRGAKLDLFTTRVKTPISEFDLFTAEENTIVDGVVKCSLVTTKGLALAPITIRANTRLEKLFSCYPGDTISHQDKLEEKKQSDTLLYRYNDVNITPLLQLQRLLLPIVYLALYTSTLYLFSYLTSFWDRGNLDSTIYITIRTIICFYAVSVTSLIFSSILSSLFGDNLAFTVDRIAYLSFQVLRYYFDTTQMVVLVHRYLFGAKASLYSQMMAFETIAPSEAKYLTLDEGAYISNARISASKSKPTKIGKFAKIGITTSLEEGVTVGVHSCVSSMSHAPADTKVEDFMTYYNANHKSKSNSNPDLKLDLAGLYLNVLAKISIQWVIVWTLILVTVYVVYLVNGQIGDAPLWIQITTLLSTALVTGGLFNFATDALATHLFVPVAKKGEKKVIGYQSFRAACYVIHCALRSQTDAYSTIFLGGTYFTSLHMIICGAKIKNPFKLILLGFVYDPNALEIENDDWVVAEEKSLIEGHKLEYGFYTFSHVSLESNISVHCQGQVASQHVQKDVIIGRRTRIMFTPVVSKRKSGFYTRVPAVECSLPSHHVLQDSRDTLKASGPIIAVVEKVEHREKIAIIGSGPSGLTTAYRLLQKGYTDITIYDNKKEGGGKVLSYSLPSGGVAEMGQLVFLMNGTDDGGKPSEADMLIKELKLKYNLVNWDLLAYRGKENEHISNKSYSKDVTIWSRSIVEAWKKDESEGTLNEGESTGDFLRRHSIPYEGNYTLASLWIGCGYGSYYADIPVKFMYEYSKVLSNVAYYFMIEGGNQQLWKTTEAQCVKQGVVIHHDTPVSRVETLSGSSSQVKVTSKRGPEVYDKVIMATNPMVNRKILASQELKDFFGKWIYHDYASSLIYSPSLARYISEKGLRPFHMLAQELDNEKVDIQGRPFCYMGTPGDHFVFYQFANMNAIRPHSDTQNVMPDSELKEKLKEYFQEIGVEWQDSEIKELITWDYFPYLQGKDIKALDTIHEMQGVGSIYYTGAWQVFEIVEGAIRMANRLVERHF